MAGVAALCGQCGALFEARNIFGGIGGPNTRVTLTGNRVSCPTPGCGGMAAILDGVFTLNNDELTLVSGSRFTRDQIAKLKALQAAVQKTGSVTDDIVSAAEAIAPEFGSILRLAKHNRWRAVVIAGMIGLLAKSCESGGGQITLNFSPQVTITQNINAGHFALTDPDQSKQQHRPHHSSPAADGAGKKER